MKKYLFFILLMSFVLVAVFFIGRKESVVDPAPVEKIKTTVQNRLTEIKKSDDDHNVFDHKEKPKFPTRVRSKERSKIFNDIKTNPGKIEPSRNDNDAHDMVIHQELLKILKSKAGFKSPNDPDFDELFKEWRQRNPGNFNYSGGKWREGEYSGIYQYDGHPIELWPFETKIRLKTNNKKIRMIPLWVKWAPFPDGRHFDLKNFSSPYHENETFSLVLSLPVHAFGKPLENLEDCQEITVLPHYDEGDLSTVRAFNARGYCRRSISTMSFIGWFSFRYKEKQNL